MTGGKSDQFSFSEFDLKEALRILEDEGVVAILGNKKAQVIRLLVYN